MKLLIGIMVCLSLLSIRTQVHAWGVDGHRIICAVALEKLDHKAAQEVEDLLGSANRGTVAEACVWADRIRSDPEWSFSSPYHYVNIAEHAGPYDRQRDCGESLCVTEAIKHFASQLQDVRLEQEKRAQALKWLGHLVADLHQPLHAGYRKDRGGNDVMVEYLGEAVNYHAYWDSVLLKDRIWSWLYLGWSWRSYTNHMIDRLPDTISNQWRPGDTDQWTNESHGLVKTHFYPVPQVISGNRSDQDWIVIEQQLLLAAQRLATLINALIGEGSVNLD